MNINIYVILNNNFTILAKADALSQQWKYLSHNKIEHFISFCMYTRLIQDHAYQKLMGSDDYFILDRKRRNQYVGFLYTFCIFPQFTSTNFNPNVKQLFLLCSSICEQKNEPIPNSVKSIEHCPDAFKERFCQC